MKSAKLMFAAAFAAMVASGADAEPLPYSDAFGAAVRAYLLDNPSVMLEVFARIQDLEEAHARDAVSALISEHEGALFRSKAARMGSPDGEYIVVEFFDYACGFCSLALTEVEAAMAERDDITVVLKELPILGPSSELAARVGLALRESAGDGAYLAYHRELMMHPARLDAALVEDVIDELGLGFDFSALRDLGDSPEISAELWANQQLAQALGVLGTPGFVFRDEIVAGLVQADTLIEKLESAGATR